MYRLRACGAFYLRLLSIFLLIWSALLASWLPVVFAQAADGVIAYVLPNDETGDEIHLIAPEGTGDRRIWHTNQPDPEQVEAIRSLAWHPAATELAFVSNHERGCSLFETDIFSIRPDGSGYRRVTQPPACAHLSGYPRGTVHVPVRNFTFDATVFFVYFQGAAGIQLITLGAGESGMVTFENVADLGEEVIQTAVAMGGAGRWLDVAASADVVAGGEVTTPMLTISSVAFPEFGADWAAWHRSGSKLAYVLGFGSPYQIERRARPLEVGGALLRDDEVETPLFVNHLAWGPTAERAEQILYDGGGDFGVPSGIYLTTAGSDDAGERLVSFETYDMVYGLAWLPDASGFVYSVSEEFLSRSNVYVYRFETQESTRLTDFADRFAQMVTVSPDGQRVVFESAVVDSTLGLEFTDYALWIMDIDGGNLRRLVENGRAPAWSPQEPRLPPWRWFFRSRIQVR